MNPHPLVRTGCRIGLGGALLLTALACNVQAQADEPEMALVPGGWFTMGAGADAQAWTMGFGWPGGWTARIADLVKSAGPPREVYLDVFLIDRVETTNRRYRDFVIATGFPSPVFWGRREDLSRPEQPVVGVSWFEAAGYCNWADKRLPSEAEWEKAARGAQPRTYPWGDVWDAQRLHTAEAIAGEPLADFARWRAWQNRSDKRSAHPADVGSYPKGASPYGVMDMAGNVWEWVADWYAPNYYAEAPARNPSGPAKGARKVLRGGGWDVPRTVATTWFRENVFPPHQRGSTVTGFRCARDLARSDEPMNLVLLGPTVR